MGHRSISDDLSIEDSTSTSYLTAKAEYGGRASFYGEEKIRSPAKGQLEEPLKAIIGQPIGARSWTTEGAGKMAKHPWGEKEAFNF